MTALYRQLCHISPATLALICAFSPLSSFFLARTQLLNLPQIPHLPCLLLHTDSGSAIYLSLDPLVSTVVDFSFLSALLSFLHAMLGLKEGWGAKQC